MYRGSGIATFKYNSSEGYYASITNQTESLISLSEITGQDNFIIEFDAKLNGVTGNQFFGIAGICAYENNNNYRRLSCHNSKIAERRCINGIATEYESDVLTTVSRGDLLHYKFTISNNHIVEEVTRGTTTIAIKTTEYTPTNDTKYGIALIWDNGWTENSFLKNIKIRSL